jgi:hypothetical protein
MISVKLAVSQLVKQIPSFSEILMFTTLLTRTRHWSLSVPDESSPHPYILFFKIHFKFYHLRRGPTSGLFPLDFLIETLPAFVFFPCVFAHLFFLDSIVTNSFLFSSIFLSVPPYKIQIFSMAPSS